MVTVNTSMNDPVRNPVTAGFAQSLRAGAAGLAYGVRMTWTLGAETVASLVRGDWENAKRYGSVLAEGIVKGWLWGTIRTAALLVWGGIKMTTPLGLFETVPTWWKAVKGVWEGKRGKWDVLLTSLFLAANVIGMAGVATGSLQMAKGSRVEPMPADSAWVEVARQGWEAADPKDVPSDWALRLPQDATAIRAVQRLASTAPKEALIGASQQVKAALLNGEQVPPLEEILPPEAFQYIDEIARAQVFGEGEHLVIGKYAGQDAGYIGAARTEGGLYYNTHPEVYATLKAAFGDQAGDVAWLINQRVLELYA